MVQLSDQKVTIFTNIYMRYQMTHYLTEKGQFRWKKVPSNHIFLHSGEYKPLSGTHFNKKVVIDHAEHLSVINV